MKVTLCGVFGWNEVAFHGLSFKSSSYCHLRQSKKYVGHHEKHGAWRYLHAIAVYFKPAVCYNYPPLDHLQQPLYVLKTKGVFGRLISRIRNQLTPEICRFDSNTLFPLGVCEVYDITHRTSCSSKTRIDGALMQLKSNYEEMWSLMCAAGNMDNYKTSFSLKTQP